LGHWAGVVEEFGRRHQRASLRAGLELDGFSVQDAETGADVFVFDSVTPVEVTAGPLYVAVVLMAVRFCPPRGVLIVAGGCMALTVLAHFLSPGDPWGSTALINRFLGVPTAMPVVSAGTGGICTWTPARGDGSQLSAGTPLSLPVLREKFDKRHGKQEYNYSHDNAGASWLRDLSENRNRSACNRARCHQR
jgi:hypothetical protein